MSAATWPACFERFFRALSARGTVLAGTPGGKGEWKAQCPAHDDTIHSLSVGRGQSGQLVVKCHAPAHCPVPEIVKAIGVRMADLYPDQAERDEKRARREKHSRWRPRQSGRTQQTPPARAQEPRGQATPTRAPERRMAVSTQQQRKPIQYYPYKDAQGNLLFETVRWEPKGFNQRRPNPNFDRAAPASRENPSHIWNLEGVTPVLYRLPELLAALKAKPDRIVLIVEGEKDVELAVAAGLVATTSPMGAGKWRPEYAQFLKGCNAVIVPDEDPILETGSSPGLKHAETVANSLMGVAASVRVVRLPGVPPKGDLTDWWHLQEGPSVSIEDIKGRLRNIINATPFWTSGQTLTAAAHVAPNPTPKPAPAQAASPPPPPVVPPPPPVANPAGNATAPSTATTPQPAAAAPASKTASVHAGAIASHPNVRLVTERGLHCAGQLRDAGVRVRSYAEFVGLLDIALRRMHSALERAGFRDMNSAEVRKIMGQEVQVMAGILMLGAADAPDEPAATAPATS